DPVLARPLARPAAPLAHGGPQRLRGGLPVVPLAFTSPAHAEPQERARPPRPGHGPEPRPRPGPRRHPGAGLERRGLPRALDPAPPTRRGGRRAHARRTAAPRYAQARPL